MKISLILLAVWLVILGIWEIAKIAHFFDVLGWGALVVGIVLLLEGLGIFSRQT